MPQIDFVATWDDALRLLEAIAADPKIKMFPDLKYSTDVPFLVSGVASIRQAFDFPTRVYIWSSEITPELPRLTAITEGPSAGKFWLCPADDHPLLSLSAYAPVDTDGIRKLYPGMISWRKNWFDGNTGVAKPMSQVGGKLISDVRKAIKGQMSRIKLHEPTWVGSEAYRLFKEGNLILVDFGRDFWIDEKGELKIVRRARSKVPGLFSLLRPREIGGKRKRVLTPLIRAIPPDLPEPASLLLQRSAKSSPRDLIVRATTARFHLQAPPSHSRGEARMREQPSACL